MIDDQLHITHNQYARQWTVQMSSSTIKMKFAFCNWVILDSPAESGSKMFTTRCICTSTVIVSVLVMSQTCSSTSGGRLGVFRLTLTNNGMNLDAVGKY